MDETFEILTLIQTGKSSVVPVVCLDRPGGDFWRGWDAYVRNSLSGRGLISPSDLALYRVTDSLQDAVQEVRDFYRNYHSSRYVEDRLVLRLHHAPDMEALERLNEAFRDILVEGRLEVSRPLPAEANEPALAHLDRLALHFNRRDVGRLRLLIDALNRLPVPATTASGIPEGGPPPDPLL